tara:strand:+ start:3729 stop:5588 length:1860 start_codon:yes stop_codon:yes gene_type:complete
MTNRSRLVFFILFWFIFSTINGQDLKRKKFDSELRNFSTDVRNAERDYKRLEDEINSLFPGHARKSPFYQNLRGDYLKFRNTIKKIVGTSDKVKENSADYKNLFSTGIMSSVDVMTTIDVNWQEGVKLTNSIEDGISQLKSNLPEFSNLHSLMEDHVRKLTGVKEMEEKMESELKDFKKEVKKVQDDFEDYSEDFSDLNESVKQFRVYSNVDTMRLDLDESLIFLSSRVDSLSLLNQNLDYLLEGRSREGDEKQVWELYEAIQSGGNVLGQNISKLINQIKEEIERFDTALELVNEFEKIMTELNEKISEYADQQSTFEIKQVKYIRVYTSLTDTLPGSYTLTDFPYSDLDRGFNSLGNWVDSGSEYLKILERIQQKFIETAGKSNTDSFSESQFKVFRSIQKEFKEKHKEAEKIHKEFEDVSEEYEEVVYENFANTAEYWDLKYEVTEDKTIFGDITIEENYGYLHDFSEYPKELYHGVLIDVFQLKLKKEKDKKDDTWKYSFIYNGENPFAVEGFHILSEDSLLFKINKKDIKNIKEKEKKGVVNFEWIIPIQQNDLEKFANSINLVLMIEFIIVEHKITWIQHNQKIFKEYLIPKVRIDNWRKMSYEGEKSAVSEN